MVAQLGSYSQAQGDEVAAKGHYAEAEQILARSKQLDPKYKDTDGRLADVYRLQGRLDEALALYEQAIAANPHALDTNIERIVAAYAGKPEQLTRLKEAYKQAAAARLQDGLLQSVTGLVAVKAGDLELAVTAYGAAVAAAPQRIDYQRNYTIVLSDTQRYTQALSQAQQTLQLAQQQQAPESEVATLQFLVNYLQQRAAGGQ
jgi:tetratricopeptide (TPR) repeat protein